MTISHRIQLDPTDKQKRYFCKAAGTARFVWNFALAEWNAQYKAGGKPTANELKRYFNSFKYEAYPWLANVHRDAHSRPFANLRKAFAAFFSGSAKRPSFKKKGKCRDSFYVACDKFSVDGCRVRLPLVGSVRMTETLRLTGKIQSATVSRDADRWFVSISVDMPDEVPVKPTGKPVGVDLGLKTFATLSTGEKIESPKPMYRTLRKLQRLSRQHSRKTKGSNNRKKSAMKLARHHWRIKCIRADFLHKTTTRLAKNHGEIFIEDLNISGMIRNRSLSRAIADAGWAEFRRQLEYKTRLYGSTLTVRDRFFASSKICSDCGSKVSALPLSVRDWTCPACGSLHDRDVNAAKNLAARCTEGYSGINASEDCSAGLAEMPNETAVVEGRTTTVRPKIRSHRR